MGSECYSPIKPSGILMRPSFCGSSAPLLNEIVSCNSDVPCPERVWVPLAWSSCSATCEGVQRRFVHCRQKGSTRNLVRSFCTAADRPASERPCRPPCLGQWSEWTPSSSPAATCGRYVAKERRNCSK